MNSRVLLWALATAAVAQSRSALPVFETISIRHASQGDGPATMQIPAGDNTVTIVWKDLREIFAFAYNVSPALVVGGPSWETHDAYDIQANAPGPDVVPESERREMLRSLLADRFRLKFHRELSPVSAFVLARGKNGPNMKEREPGDDGESAIFHTVCPPHLVGQNASMEELAKALEPILFQVSHDGGHKLVLDKTELLGRFDFELTWSDPPAVGSVLVGISTVAPPLSVAIQDQLGLRLYPVKVRREVLVIDHLERPFVN